MLPKTGHQSSAQDKDKVGTIENIVIIEYLSQDGWRKFPLPRKLLLRRRRADGGQDDDEDDSVWIRMELRTAALLTHLIRWKIDGSRFDLLYYWFYFLVIFFSSIGSMLDVSPLRHFDNSATSSNWYGKLLWNSCYPLIYLPTNEIN